MQQKKIKDQVCLVGLNIIPEERTLFEAHQKYINAMASVRSETEKALAEMKATVSERDTALSVTDTIRSKLEEAETKIERKR